MKFQISNIFLEKVYHEQRWKLPIKQCTFYKEQHSKCCKFVTKTTSILLPSEWNQIIRYEIPALVRGICTSAFSVTKIPNRFGWMGRYFLGHFCAISNNRWVKIFDKYMLNEWGLVQKLNFSCSKPSVNDLKSLFELICIRFGTWKVRRLN